MSVYDSFLNELNAAVVAYHKFKNVGIDLSKLTPNELIKTKPVVKAKAPKAVTVKAVTKSAVAKKKDVEPNTNSLEDRIVLLLKTKDIRLKPSDIFEIIKDQDHGFKLKQLPVEISAVLSSLKKKKVVQRLEDKTYQLV